MWSLLDACDLRHLVRWRHSTVPAINCACAAVDPSFLIPNPKTSLQPLDPDEQSLYCHDTVPSNRYVNTPTPQQVLSIETEISDIILQALHLPLYQPLTEHANIV